LKMPGFWRGSKGRLGIFGLAPMKKHTASIRLCVQIRDTRTGSIAWEGVEEFTAAYVTIAQKTVSFKSLVTTPLTQSAPTTPRAQFSAVLHGVHVPPESS